MLFRSGKTQQKRTKNALCEVGARLVEYESSHKVGEDDSPVRVLRERMGSVRDNGQMMEWCVEEVLSVVGE